MAVRGKVAAFAAMQEVAERDPERLALEAGNDRMTYAELDAATASVAAALVDRLGPGRHHVILRVEATKALLVGSVAIARAGLVSVPLDPTMPVEHLRRVAADVGAALILSDDPNAEGGPVEVVDPLDLVGEPPSNWEDVPHGAYVAIAFSSGSTGEPKGILVAATQRAVGQTGSADLSVYGFEGAARIGIIATGSSNLTEGSLQACVALGATAVAYEIRRDGLDRFAEWARTANVFWLFAIPTLLRHLLATLGEHDVITGMRALYIAGEVLTWEDIAEIRPHLPPEAVIYNLFGNTESGACLRFAVDADTPLGTGRLPLGVLLPDRTVELLDEAGHPVPAGDVGEIVVTGRETALGYWNRPEETAELFTDLGDGLRRVRTRDLGRLLPDGNVEYCGRIDHMVKIAGHRVELGQVEATLRQLDGVADAAATTYVDDAGDLRLTACVVAADGCVLHPSVLRLELARRLPAPMLPDGISVLEELPRLPGGKVDRLQLPVARALPRESAAPPRTELERRILGHWRRVLGVDLGVEDDFFAVGGDSLRGARIITAVNEELGVELAVSALVEAPTVRRLAAVVEAAPDPSPLVVARSEGDGPPLFLVHDVFGEVVYTQLIASLLPAGFPVYGIRGQAVEGRMIAEESVQELASRYIGAIRTVRPHGPYLLYGWSSGGTIAFEIASQLRRAGEDIHVLLVGDSPAPGLPVGISLGFRARADLRKREMARMSRPEAAGYALRLVGRQLAFRAYRLAARLTGRPRPPAGYGAAEAAIAAAAASGSAVPPALRGTLAAYTYGGLTAAYKPDGVYDGPLTILRCSKSEFSVDGWNAYLAAPYKEIPFAGGHLDLGSEAGIRTVAEVLAGEIRAAVQPAN
ncbi:MAG TPA: AMP-binding protein [Gaiellaceae bacterium]|nr:AMP-binding protein [Gaiellaceae bacterium]